MAFSRKWLESLGLTEVQVSAIIEEHTAVTDALKEQREAAKKEADKLPAIQKELDDLKNGEDFKAKYEKEHQDFEDFKAGIAEKEEADKIRTAYRKLLTDERVKEDRLDMVMRHTDFSNMKLDKDGNLENADALKKTIAEDWGVFQVTTHERKQSVATPPKGGSGTGMSRAKELAQKFAQERYGIKPDAGKEKNE